MNLLGAILYDPAVAVTKVATSSIGITAIDTTNLRLTVTVPSHGYLRVLMSCGMAGQLLGGFWNYPTVMLGVLEGSTVRARMYPATLPSPANGTTTSTGVMADFVIPGLTPGPITLDAAYGVEGSASGGISYGGPNNGTSNDAWGAFSFAIYDPISVPTAVDIADAILKRDMSAVSGEADRSLLNAIRFLRNKWDVASGILTVKKEDDSTTAWTSSISTNPSAKPIVGSDPT